MKPCINIIRLYNYCIQRSELLDLNTQKCFQGEFEYWEQGSLLVEYNHETYDKCGNVVLPFIAYAHNNEELEDPLKTYGYCDAFITRITDVYINREAVRKSY